MNILPFCVFSFPLYYNYRYSLPLHSEVTLPSLPSTCKLVFHPFTLFLPPQRPQFLLSHPQTLPYILAQRGRRGGRQEEKRERQITVRSKIRRTGLGQRRWRRRQLVYNLASPSSLLLQQLSSIYMFPPFPVWWPYNFFLFFCLLPSYKFLISSSHSFLQCPFFTHTHPPSIS